MEIEDMIQLRMKRSYTAVVFVLIYDLLLYSHHSYLQFAEASWSEWSAWTECSVTCGEGGVQQKTRTCLSDPSACMGPQFDGQGCTMGPCPVDGYFLDWTTWTNCTVSCGGGSRTRNRMCQEPLHGGAPCDGADHSLEMCNEDPCPVEGVWSNWTSWSPCSVSCGGGLQTKNRTCNGPFYGGEPCNGTDVDSLECNADNCPIHGAWSEWSEWSQCTVSCNEGREDQHRSCTDPAPQYGGEPCPGRKKRNRVCFPEVCPINGGWSLWTPWTDCSLSCGWGTRLRSRICDDPAPMYGGIFCIGTAKAVASCLDSECSVDAEWGRWGPWTPCSQTCGSNGTYSRTRECDAPPALYGGDECTGSNNMSSECYVTRCEGDGGWSEWSQWSNCSESCEGGLEVRNRSCDSPIPSSPYGEDCRGASDELRECNTHICPVHGGWTPWTLWTPCPVTCGGDIQTRYHICTNPPPLFNGRPCQGDINDERDCATNGCPVKGQWAVWAAWSDCSVSCGGGTTTRERTCTDPAPAWGGRDCPARDETLQTLPCNNFKCPIDGQWSEWSPWDTCPVTCDGFFINRTRTCDEPRPRYNGADCPGSDTDSTLCAETPCPVNGSWMDWSGWSQCTLPCNNGTQLRTRTCIEPAAAHGGFNCYGEQSEEVDEEEETVLCNDIPCPIDGGYSEWSDWPPCPVTCGGASITKNRSCDNPEPMHGGKDCNGPSTESLICNGEIQCPIDGNWGRWLNWSPCTRSCHGGMTTRIRLCNDPSPLYGGNPCEGSWELTSACNGFACPVNGGFSQWTPWEPCSKTCGGGQTSRTRDCTDPAPRFGGQPCYGPSVERKLCAAFYCPVNGGWSPWSPWSPCAVTCGGAIANRTRTCTNPSPRHEGLLCEGPVDDWTVCANYSCPIDGYWSSWGSWSDCSTSCGEGFLSRTRLCDDPPAQFGGILCPGEGQREVYCSMTEYCPDEVPVAVNVTSTVQVSDVTLTLILEWDVSPAESQIDSINIEVKSLLPRPNSTVEWESYAHLPRDSGYFPLRDIEGISLFTSSLGIRIVVSSQSGESTSEERFLNVAEYIPKVGSDSQRRRPPLWPCILGISLSLLGHILA